jgi:hypothetical protein
MKQSQFFFASFALLCASSVKMFSLEALRKTEGAKKIAGY